MFPRSGMLTLTFWWSSRCLIGSNRFCHTERWDSILSSDKNNYIQHTSRTAVTPAIKISTTCQRLSTSSVAFSGSTSESSMSKPSFGGRWITLPPAKSSLPGLIWLPHSSQSHIPHPNSWDPQTSIKENILMLYSKISEYYSTLGKSQCTTWQYRMAHFSLSSIRVISWHMYGWIYAHNCTLDLQWY